MRDRFVQPRWTAYAFDRRGIFFALGLTACIDLAGCGGPDGPMPIFASGTNYAAVPVTSDPGVSQASALSLYHYPEGPKGPSSMIWPYLTAEDEVVFDQLVIFNGGLSDDITWKYYPALLAYAGGGNVVEISQPACRHIPGWQADWTNYAFSVLTVSNGFVRLDASQNLPIETNRPKRLEVDLDRAEIMKVVQAAQTNGEAKTYDGVKYFMAR